MKIEIIKETNDYLIINKPAGLIVHGGDKITEPTLVDWLLKKYPHLKNVGEDPARPAIVHRLDKEASGLMIIPKNNLAFEYFKDQFKKRKIKKEYQTLVFGKISKDEDVIDFPIKRSSQGHKMASIPKSIKNFNDTQENTADSNSYNNISNRSQGNVRALESSRQAITEFEIIKRFINFTLLKIKMKTGRTHQIRVHFSAYGHPLLGDNLYGNKKTKVKNNKLNIGRIFLMATKLSFTDLKEEKQELEIDLSSDLKEILKKIK
ncbi:MAG: RNA pseudouridine synthase [Patescibacteria group bacterium]|jgi:23S rRNA pseudouridine1911/1915/1917 synthase